MRTGFTFILIGFGLYLIGGAVWGQSIWPCAVTHAESPSCLHAVGIAMAGVGATAIGFGVIAVIMSLFMRREVRRQEARF